MQQPAPGTVVTRPGQAYAWVILIFCFLTLLVSMGIRGAQTAFIVPWEQAFGITRTSVGAVMTVSMVVFGLFQAVAGRLADRFGIRPVMSGSMLLLAAGMFLSAIASQTWHLYLYFGVIVGLGTAGTSNAITAAAIARWFVARRGLAFGLMITGMSAGRMVLAPLSIYLLEGPGLRVALGVLGLIALVMVPALILFVRSQPSDLGLRAYGAPADPLPAGSGAPVPAATTAGPTASGSEAADAAPLPFWRLPAFWYLVIPYFFCGFTSAGIMHTHFVPYSVSLDLAASASAAAVAVASVTTAIGAVISGPLSDRFRRGYLLSLLYAARLVIFLAAIYWVRTPLSLIIFGAVFGLTDFATIAPTMGSATDIFGLSRVGLAAGLVSLIHQLGAAAGTLVPGMLFDLTNGYAVTMLLAAVGSGLASYLSYRLPAGNPARNLTAV